VIISILNDELLKYTPVDSLLSSVKGGLSTVSSTFCTVTAASHSLLANMEWSLEWYTSLDDEEDRMFKDIIRSAVEGNDPAGIEAAAIEIDKLAAQAEGPYFAKSVLTTVEDILIYVASILSYDSPSQDALVSLVATLRSLPDRKDAHHCEEWRSWWLGSLPGILHEAAGGRYFYNILTIMPRGF